MHSGKFALPDLADLTSLSCVQSACILVDANSAAVSFLVSLRVQAFYIMFSKQSKRVLKGGRITGWRLDLRWRSDEWGVCFCEGLNIDATLMLKICIHAVCVSAKCRSWYSWNNCWVRISINECGCYTVTHPVSLWGPVVNGLLSFVWCFATLQVSLCYFSEAKSVLCLG